MSLEFRYSLHTLLQRERERERGRERERALFPDVCFNLLFVVYNLFI